MRNQDELIRKTLGQLDSSNENTRLVAFEKARAMLQSRGITFAELFDSQAELERLKAANAAANARADELIRKHARKPSVVTEISDKYIHDNEIPFWKRRHKGKPVRRKEYPPTGVVGTLKILSDEPTFKHTESDCRTLIMSFETEDYIYHDYETKSSSSEYLNCMRDVSAKQRRFRYKD